MVVRHGRFGRKNGKGFYDYPANGPKSLWPGLASIVGKRLDPDAISVKDLKDRYLFTVALEAARCLFEGIVTDPREADVGSILGFGYAPYSGGAISFIDGMGLKEFVARAKTLAAKYGPNSSPATSSPRWPSGTRRSTESTARNRRRRRSPAGRSKPKPAEGDFHGGFFHGRSRSRDLPAGCLWRNQHSRRCAANIMISLRFLELSVAPRR